MKHTVWKVSEFGVFLFWIFWYLDWTQNLLYKSPYSVQIHENTDQNKSNLDKFDKVKHAYFILVLGKQLWKILPDGYSA